MVSNIGRFQYVSAISYWILRYWIWYKPYNSGWHWTQYCWYGRNCRYWRTIMPILRNNIADINIKNH